MNNEQRLTCPSCGTAIGQLHKLYCDVERHPDNGLQMLANYDEGTPLAYPRIPWDGYWPGMKECIEWGWYAYFVPNRGWITCGKDAPEAIPDLNRLFRDAVWDPKQACWVKKE